MMFNLKRGPLMGTSLILLLISSSWVGCVYRKYPRLEGDKIKVGNFYTRDPLGEEWLSFKGDSSFHNSDSVTTIDSYSIKCPQNILSLVAWVNHRKPFFDHQPIPMEVPKGSFQETALKYVAINYESLRSGKKGPEEFEFISSETFSISSYPAVEVIYHAVEDFPMGCGEFEKKERTKLIRKYVFVKNIHKERWGKVLGAGYPDFMVFYLTGREEGFDISEEDFDKVVQSIQFVDRHSPFKKAHWVAVGKIKDIEYKQVGDEKSPADYKVFTLEVSDWEKGGEAIENQDEIPHLRVFNPEKNFPKETTGKVRVFGIKPLLSKKPYKYVVHDIEKVEE